MLRQVFAREQEKKQMACHLVLLLTSLLLLFVSAFVSTRAVSAASVPPGASFSGHPSSWRPIGTWKLTVTFVTLNDGFQGSRQGQVESSLMTFLPNGRLTASLPGSSSASSHPLPPVINGAWYMTGLNLFHYHFQEPLFTEGKMVAYVQVQTNATLVSPTAYVAGGVGVAYSASTGRPIAGQYNVTSTVAVPA